MRLTATTTHKTLVALLASSFLWACQNEYLPYINNKPGTPKEVQLVFSSSGELQDTRMTAVNGNENGKLKNLSFIPYAITADADAVTKDNRRLDGIIKFNQNDFQNTVFQNVSVPIGTNSFLVYGEDVNNNEGKLHLELDKETSAIEIFPVSYTPLNSESYKKVLSHTTTLNGYLSDIANSKGWSTDMGLKPLYEEFIGLQAGSSMNILATIQRLYIHIAPATEGTNEEIRKEIRENILKGMDIAEDGKLSFKDGFPKVHPMDYGLPAGSAVITWDGEKFINAATTVSPLKVAPSESYAYPAGMWYHANSRVSTSTLPVRESIREISESGMPQTCVEKSWEEIVEAFNGHDNTPMKGSVSTATQSILLNKRMQYGVARLDLRIRATSNTLIDNMGAEVTIEDTNIFPLTGILVGGQDKVDFDFHQFENTSPEYAIYDKNVSGLHLYMYEDFQDSDNPKTASTLVLETQKLKVVNGKYPPVMFALEFENKSGKEFRGVDQKIIAPGCKFYLIGNASPTEIRDEYTDKCVFEQDKITKLNVTVESLKNAYYIIPDLRDPQLRVGITVDNWTLSTPSGPIIL